MHRSLVAAAALLVLAGCKVQETPPEFYSHPDPAVVDRQEAADEIRGRVRLFADALGRGDMADAVGALAPDELASVVGVDDNGGMARLGTAGVQDAVGQLAITAPVVVRTPDLRVGTTVGMGWFATHLQILSPTVATEPVLLRMTGVFARERGEWRLVEAHISRPDAAPAATAADSLPRRGAPSPDSAAAPAEGG